MLQRRALDCPAVEEARRAMVSAGYVLPPQCHPVPLEPRRRPPPVAATTSSTSTGGRRHSISCSPVRGVLPTSAAAAVSAASADAQRLGQKRRFSLPYSYGGGLDEGVPLTAFLPSEFKRRRTSTAPSSPRPVGEPVRIGPVSTETPTLPSIGELVGNHPEPCLPPHTAATPDRPHFSPSLAAPMPLDQQQHQTAAMPTHPVVLTTDHPSTALYSNPTSSTIMSTSSSSSTPTSSAPSSPRMQRLESAADQQLARDEAHAEKARRAERVAEILELMDRQNNGAATNDIQTTAFGDAEHDGSGWPVAGDVKRRRVGKDQTGILDLMFKVEPMPTQVTKKRLADGLGMTYKQVQIWFQNKRARCKRAVEAPPRSSHTFHNVLVSSDGRFMMKELAKARQESQQSSPSHQLYDHHEPSSAAPPPVALRSCILTQ